MPEGNFDKPLISPPSPAKKPEIGKTRRFLASIGIALSSLTVLPACSPEGNIPVMETKAGDTIPLVSGTIRPTEDINVRTTPSIIDTSDSISGNRAGTLEEGKIYQFSNVPIVEGYDVDQSKEVRNPLLGIDDEGNSWLRIFDVASQEYRYISLWAVRDMFEVTGQKDVKVSKMDEQGNIFIVENGVTTQIGGVLVSNDK